MASLLDAATGRVLSRNLRRADTPWSRTVGFLFRTAIGEDETLLFDRCSAVHTLGMRVEIDVIFLDEAGAVVQIVPGARRNQPVLRAEGARDVVEAASGFAAARGLRVGDRLTVAAT